MDRTHTLVVLDNRTFLVPTRHLPPEPWDADSFTEWEVPPEEAKAWQLAKLDAGLQELDRLGQVFGALLGGDPERLKGMAPPGDPAEARRTMERALRGLKRAGGGQAVKKAWAGPEGEQLAKAVERALGEIDGE